jgi:Subtilase family
MVMSAPALGANAKMADAYLQMAYHNQYLDFVIDEQVTVLVQFEKPLNATRIGDLSKNGFFVENIYINHTIARASVAVTAINAWLQAGTDAFGIQSIELSAPINLNNRDWSESLAQHISKSTSDVLLGVLDSGCPFAHKDFATNTKTRVIGLWVQGIKFKQQTPSLFSYGKRFTHGGLNSLVSHGENSAYLGISATYLRSQLSHGAPVLNLLAGSTPQTARWRNGNQPPTWMIEVSTATQADIVCVDFPDKALEDSTGRWLGRYVLDGIHFILEHRKTKQQKTVINISYGPTTGPHDGSSLLEQAFVELLEKNENLHLVVASGNSRLSRLHADCPLEKGSPITLHWVIPPDSAGVNFAEIWLPTGLKTSDCTVTLTPPTATTLTAYSMTADDRLGMFLCRIAPTAGRDGVHALAPHGVWTISIATHSDNAQGNVHVYVAHTGVNLGFPLRARPSYLTDSLVTSNRHNAASPLGGVGAVTATGTLNGIGTAVHSRFHLVGAMVASTAQQSSYSDAGPSRGARKSTNKIANGDDSPALHGILVGGTRSQSYLRLSGTSLAAPQVARLIANS